MAGASPQPPFLSTFRRRFPSARSEPARLGHVYTGLVNNSHPGAINRLGSPLTVTRSEQAQGWIKDAACRHHSSLWSEDR